MEPAAKIRKQRTFQAEAAASAKGWGPLSCAKEAISKEIEG